MKSTETRNESMIEKKVEEMVYEKVIQPFEGREYGYVGAELEYLILPADNETPLADMGSDFLHYLVEQHGFEVSGIGSDGRYMRVTKEGDDVSFDYSYLLLEFSMAKQRSLMTIWEHFLPMFRTARDYYEERGCKIGCFGRNPFHTHRGEYTQDAFYSMIRKYLMDYSQDKDLNKYFTNMASVQTHIDVPMEHLLKTYNLFNELDFVGALLFSNSGKLEDPESEICCMRDEYWEKCGIPDIGVYAHDFASLEELAVAIAQEEIFIRPVENGIEGMQPVSLEEYFGRQGNPQEYFQYFRSFRHVVLNSYHVLEVRSDCTQPLADCLLPGAFHVGIAMNYEKAAALVKEFKNGQQITEDNAVLRKKAAVGVAIAGEKPLYEFLGQLYELAKEGLVKRGYGEEKLLTGLKDRIDRRENPAGRARRLLAETGDFMTVAEEFCRE